VFSPRGSQWVSAGQLMIARGSTADPEFQWWPRRQPMHGTPGRTAATRTHAIAQRAARSAGSLRSEDLDNNGNWVYTPDYATSGSHRSRPVGRRINPGSGVAGLLWLDLVSADPGLGPVSLWPLVHRAGFGWLWYPGVFGMPHYWSPALVGFFGFGGGVGFGVGLASATSAGVRWRRMKSSTMVGRDLRFRRIHQPLVNITA